MINGLGCHKCNKQLATQRGCNGFDKPKKIKIYDLEFHIDKCYIKEVQGTFERYAQAYKFYLKGIMPNDSKGYLDQPNKYIEAMLFIDSQISYMQNKESEIRTKQNA